jgi:hypothetical protein
VVARKLRLKADRTCGRDRRRLNGLVMAAADLVAVADLVDLLGQVDLRVLAGLPLQAAPPVAANLQKNQLIQRLLQINPRRNHEPI